MVRKAMNENTSISAGQMEWVSSISLGEEYIVSKSKELLEDPEISITRKDGEENLYTKDQMFEMFRLGYMAKWYGPYSLLGKMAVGDVVYLPYEAWSSIRSAAYRLKRQLGKEFHVKKMGKFGGKGEIEILRKA